jgi:hypothetical protein
MTFGKAEDSVLKPTIEVTFLQPERWDNIAQGNARRM